MIRACVLPWTPNDPEQALEAKQKLQTWPLDEHNAALLNEVHPRGYDTSLSDSDTPPHVRFLLVSKILSARIIAFICMHACMLSSGLPHRLDCVFFFFCHVVTTTTGNIRSHCDRCRCGRFGIVQAIGAARSQERNDFGTSRGWRLFEYVDLLHSSVVFASICLSCTDWFPVMEFLTSKHFLHRSND